jgi:hypothetical protein
VYNTLRYVHLLDLISYLGFLFCSTGCLLAQKPLTCLEIVFPSPPPPPKQTVHCVINTCLDCLSVSRLFRAWKLVHVEKVASLFSTNHRHPAVCLTTGPHPLPERVLHMVRSSASSFNFQYPVSFLRLSSSC